MADSGELLPIVLVLNTPTSLKLFPSLFSGKFTIISSADPSAASALALYGNNLTSVDADLLRRFPELRIFVSSATGFEGVDLAECRRRGVEVANAGAAYTVDVADVAVGLLIDVFRRVSASDRFVRDGLWRSDGVSLPLGSKLRGKRVGVVGLGRIGLEVAKRLKPFGCIISYTSRTQKPLVTYPFYPSTRDLAAHSDALVLCCDLNSRTHHVVNREVLSALGKEGVIINVGRGALVDEKELVGFLVRGEIGGAGLDVFEHEPNVPVELFELENVVLSPHKAVFTHDSFRASAEMTIANLEAFFAGKPLLTPVTNGS